MPQVEKITTILDKMFYTLSSSNSFSILILQVVLLLLSIIRYYAIPLLEPSDYKFINIITIRICGIIGFGVLYIVSNKCKIRALMTFSYIAIPFIVFELNAYFVSVGDAYMTYAFLYTSFKEIMLLNMNSKAIYISESVHMIYHAVRAIIFKYQYKSYSYFVFLSYFLSYIFINMPIVNHYTVVRENILDYEKLRRDFENLIFALPIPTFKFSKSTQAIEMVNAEFQALLDLMKIKDTHEFMRILSVNTQLFDSINNNIVCDSFLLCYNNREYSLKYRKLEENEGNLYVACIQDISLVKEVESLKAKETYKQMFISVINHQLRTPLNGIYCPLHIIKERNLCSETKEYVDLAINSLEVLTALIDDTIAFSECNNGKMKLNLTRGNILLELQKLKKMFAFESNQKNVAFQYSITLKHQYIFADIKKIMQILIILVSNAFKYTYKGVISLMCKEQGNMLLFEISDTGIGIKEECLSQLFNEFSSPEKVINEKATSSGFQLSLVKKLVTLMGGHITVNSTYGVGTTFSLLLNVEWAMLNKSITENMLEEEITENVQNKNSPLPSINLKFLQVSNTKVDLIPNNDVNNGIVLVVDDNSTNLFVLQKMLNLLMVKSEKAMNGLECINKVSERGLCGYAMILMDINMPVMNGFEAAKAINKMKIEGKVADIPIIAVTAQNETSMIEQCKQIGICKCIFKPIKMTELKELIFEYKIREDKVN